MKIKGFTLIELLAVIVILAIIALIAVPIILDLIGNTKVSAAKRSVENYIDAVELYLVRSELDQNKVTLERNNRYNVTNSTMIGEKTYPAINDLVEITGSKPTGTDDYVQLNEKGKVTDAKLTIGGYEVEIKDGKITSVKGGALVSLESISLNITNQTMEKDSTFKLIPTFAPSNASNQEVTYESNDTNIVTVDNQGNVTAINTGSTKVVVTSKENENIKAECNITVVITATGLTLTPTTAEIKTGETVQLEGTISPSNTTTNALTWVSSNADIASVDSNGLVTGISKGEVTIIASTVNGIEATCTIKVKFSILKTNSYVENVNTPFLGGTINRSQVESIVITNTKEVPNNVIGSWDVSDDQDGSIMAWYRDEDNNNLYELYIGGEGGVKANPNSSFLFYRFNNVTTIDVTNLDTSYVTDMHQMFQGCNNLLLIDVSNFDTSKVTSMSSMFSDCNKLISLNVGDFKTNQVTNMDCMFYSCNKLEILDLKNWNTSNLTSMFAMFANCTNLTELDLSSFDTSNVINMGVVFGSCKKLKNVDISNFNTNKVIDMNSMFFECNSLITINMKNATFTSVTSYNNMFSNALSLTTVNVKDIDSKSFIESRLLDNSINGVLVEISI